MRLKSNLTRINPLSCNYELSIGGLEECSVQDNTATIQIRQPNKDTRIVGFPCLSHISLVLDKERRLNMTAIYRNQYFIQKAYGNYLGLCRLLRFVSREVGCETGALVCVAVHADAELSKKGKRDIKKLVHDCREASNHSQRAKISA